MFVNLHAGPKINENFTNKIVKEKRPCGRFSFLLHRIGEGVLAVVVLDNLVRPVVQESVLHLAGGEAIGHIVLDKRKDFLNGHRLVPRGASEHHIVRDFVRAGVGASLGGQAVILCVDFLTQNRQVNRVIAVQIVADGFQSGLLHSVSLSRF